MQNLQRTYKAEKAAYKKEINASKKSKWRELCNELENDVWGQGYKIATRQIKNKNQLYELSNEEKRGIVDELFPDWQQDGVDWEITQDNGTFTIEDLKDASKKIKTGKSPGRDGITPEVVKVAVAQIPTKLLRVFNKIDTGIPNSMEESHSSTYP